MADFTASPMGGAQMQGDSASQSPLHHLTQMTNIAGALVSLALICGIAVWGYKLFVRDVSGIPVVRAAEGDMRVRPEDPGGELALHQGLSVNAIAAEGAAERPADRLILAPPPIDLAAEDTGIIAAPGASVLPEASETAPNLLDPDTVTAAIESGNVDALVEELTAGVAPLAPVEEDQDAVIAAVTEAVAAEVSANEATLAALRDAPGVRRSFRPQLRPARFVPPSPQAAVAAPATIDVDPKEVPAGTRLAQLGAFDSPDVARAQWDLIAARFDSYMDGKSRVVQRATSGGRVFYRLRALGFEDIADARRFCSALVARNADCIPVVSR